MKRTLGILLGIAALGSIVYYKFVLDAKQKPAAQNRQTGAPVAVDVLVAKDTTISERVQVLGTVRANEEVDVVSELSRKIAKIAFAEGGVVPKGALLFKLDDADLAARFEKLKLQERLADENERRQKQLLERGGISQQTYDEALNALRTLQADVKTLQADLAKTEIRAPFGGKLGLRKVSEGAYVAPNTVLVNMQDVSAMKIDFAIPDKYAAGVRIGGEVTLRLQGLPKEYKAKVYAVESKVDAATRTLTIRALCPNKDGALTPGAFAEVQLPLAAVENTVMLPTEIIVPVLKGQIVYVCRNGQAAQQPVKIGLRTDRMAQISEGISAGDTIVASAILQMRNGTPLKIKQAR